MFFFLACISVFCNVPFFFQVEELTKEIHSRKQKDTSSVEVQTEDYAWSQAGREGVSLEHCCELVSWVF